MKVKETEGMRVRVTAGHSHSTYQTSAHIRQYIIYELIARRTITETLDDALRAGRKGLLAGTRVGQERISLELSSSDLGD